MKNIHILPTDKPSRLHSWTDENGSRLELCDLEYSHTRNTQNIYITSDVEIKIGDWVYCLREGFEPILKQKVNAIGVNGDKMMKKIILTTDTDLIKDGVQAIDDEFLEWFVRNPNCEKFEVISMPRCCGRCDGVDDLCFTDMCCNDHQEYGCEICYGKRSQYKIIIPKEEPKTNLEKLPFPELIKEFAEYYKNIPLIEESKQETLEEAAENYVKDESNRTYRFISKDSFQDGAKWQSERMCPDEKIICAAIWYKEIPLKKTIPDVLPKNCDRGLVISGHRHGQCMWVMGSLTGLRSVMNAPDGVGDYVQGFLTSKNRFVDREEAAQIWLKESPNNKLNYSSTELYSEDIY
jgi:hypothetical protein